MAEKVENPDEILRRMDLVMEKTVDKGSEVKDDEEYSVFGVQMKPNPDRDDRIDEDDRKGWIDTMDSIFYPDDVISEAWEQMDEMPMYFHLPRSKILMNIQKIGKIIWK